MKKHHLILIAILLLGFFLRLYRFDRPLADWHSWRQADTAAVTRRYVQNGIDLLHPTYDDLSNIPSGLENPQGYRMVEFPFINATTAFLYNLTSPSHNWPIHIFSRLVSITISLGSILLIYLLIQKLTQPNQALITAFIFAILPFNIFYSTTILPEVALVFFTLAMVYGVVCYSLKPKLLTLIFTAISSALALLLKPIIIFLSPALIYFYFKHQGLKGFKNWQIYIALIFAALPLIFWRNWITQYPQGIPSYSWLFNSTNIRFKGAFFRWLFAERIGKLILGYWNLIPFGIGLVLKPPKKVGWFFHLWILGLLGYFVVFATGNVTHDYYQIFTLPIIAILVGQGLSYLVLQTPKDFNKPLSLVLAITTLLFGLGFSWFSIRDYFNINNIAIVHAGQAVDKLTPQTAKVIAPYGGDTAFLYQTNRQGWPIGFEIPDKIEKGATHYISTSYDDEARALETACTLIEKTDLYILIDLANCNFPDQLDTN